AEAVARTQAGFALVGVVHHLGVATVGGPELRSARCERTAGDTREHEGRAEALADVAGHCHREVRNVGLDPGRAAKGTDRLTAGRGVRGALPQAASPHHVLVAAGLLVVGNLRLDPRDLSDVVGTAEDNARLEDADGNLRWRPALGAVGNLGVEVRIDIAVSDAARRRAARLPAADAYPTDAEQGHVLHDVLSPEQAELAASQNLGPVLEPDRQVHLAHVDLRAELVVGARVLDLRREPEVHAE